MKKLFLLSSIAILSLPCTASAALVITNNPDESVVSGALGSETKLYLDGTLFGVTQFSAQYGSQTGQPTFTFSTTGAVDVKNGYSSVDPAVAGDFTSLSIFAPVGFGFTDFKFDILNTSNFVMDGIGETNPGAHLFNMGTVTVTGAGNGDQSWTAFDLIGNSAPFESITLTGLGDNFKEMKQFEISGLEPIAGSVPEIGTWAMILLGFAGLGLFGYSKQLRIA